MSEDGSQMASTAPSSEEAPYRFVRIADPNTAVGTAARLMFALPAYAELTLRDWVGVIDGQVAREHYGFVVDAAGKVLGFMGWALATRGRADAWADGAALSSDECRAGEVLIFNAWVETEPAVHGFMVDRIPELAAGKAAIYFRRLYADGQDRAWRACPWNDPCRAAPTRAAKHQHRTSVE